MSVQAAYLGIILIWSTTPLTIQWSTQGMSFSLAVLARMVIGLATALAILLAGGTRFRSHSRALLAYFVGGLGLFHINGADLLGRPFRAFWPDPVMSAKP